VGGRIVRIRTVVRIWHRNRGISVTDFEADFNFLFVVYGAYGIVCTTNCGHEKRGKRRLYNSTVLAQKMRQISVGQIWCCEVFSLAGNVGLLLFCTFLKHNKYICLSLVGFPHIGVFPGICLNF
jgi:hypothetical protein